MSEQHTDRVSDEVDESYGFCNACGEEMWLGDECCDDGEWEPSADAGGVS